MVCRQIDCDLSSSIHPRRADLVIQKALEGYWNSLHWSILEREFEI